MVSYAVSPALPAGLTLDPGTGILSGTPAVVSSEASYTVTATNSGGSAQVSMNHREGYRSHEPPLRHEPRDLHPRADDPERLPDERRWHSRLVHSLTGVADRPDLSTTTGVIAGMPTVVSPTATYTVTATNSGGSTTAQLTVTVKDVSPLGLSYPKNPLVCTIDQPIASENPSSSGGAVVAMPLRPRCRRGSC